MMAFTLAARELRSLFLSPLAWSILAVVQFIHAYLFLTQVEGYLSIQSQLAMMEGAPGITEIIVAPLFASAAIVLLLVVPLLTMRLISEERRNQTLVLLLTSPLEISEIILGKYLGIVAFLLIMMFMAALMPLALLFGGSLDAGLLISCLIGVTLLVAAFAAIGLYMSTLTQYPTVAAISTFGVLLLLWIIDWAGGSGDGVLRYLSMLRHYESLLKGIFNSADVIYYLLFITTFLVLSIRRLDGERLQD